MSMLAHFFDLYANLSPEGPCWPFDDDTGENYCREHALAKAREAGHDKIDGGYAHEADGCVHCATCGKLLDYSLTDHGQESELAHFVTVKFRRNKPLDRETAYHLARMLWGKDNDLQAIRVAASAIRCMKRLPAAITAGQHGEKE
jgi:hypothetical protein